MKYLLPRSEVIKSIDPKWVDVLPLHDNHEVEELTAFDLLTSERFDIMANYLFAKLHLLDVAEDWGVKLFKEVRNIMGLRQTNHCDPNLRDEEDEDVKELLRLLTDHCINKEMRPIPVGQDNIIIDGANQVAAGLLFDQTLSTIKFDIKPAQYNYQYFLKNGLEQEIADAMVLEYCRLCPNMFVVVVFPITTGRNDEINETLKEYGQIHYEKEISFTELGRYNLIRLLYFNMHWIGDDSEITYGVCHHVENRFWNNGTAKFIFLKFHDPAQVLEAKSRLRALFDLKNFSIHINDTHEETVWIAEHILSTNNIFFLNNAQPWLSRKFCGALLKFHQMIEKEGLDKSNLCVTGSPVLAGFGLRDVNQIDYLTFGEHFISTMDLQNYVIQRKVIPESVITDDLIYDPRYYFYYRGIKFVALPLLREIKLFEVNNKFIKTIHLIDSLNADFPNVYRIIRNIRFAIKKTSAKISHFRITDIKTILPKFIKPLVKWAYQLIFNRNAKNNDS